MPHNENFDFKLTSDAKNQPAITGRKDSCFWLFSPWSRSTSNFCALIGQNLTGEFMRKMYAASWNLFTLTAEADRILCDVFNCLFPLDVQNEIQVLSKVFIYSRLVCLLFFGSEMRRLSKSEIRFRMVSFSFFTLLVERDQRMTIMRKVKSNRLPCL